MQRQSKHKSKSRQQSQTQWSDWVWHEEYEKYYRYYHGPDGKPHFDWYNESAAPGPSDVPRAKEVEELAERFSTTGVSTTDDSTSVNYTHAIPPNTALSQSGETVQTHGIVGSGTAAATKNHKGATHSASLTSKSKSKHRADQPKVKDTKSKDAKGKDIKGKDTLGKGAATLNHEVEAATGSAAGPSNAQQNYSIAEQSYPPHVSYSTSTSWANAANSALAPETQEQLHAAAGRPFQYGNSEAYQTQPSTYGSNYGYEPSSGMATTSYNAPYGISYSHSTASDGFDRAGTPRAHLMGPERELMEAINTSDTLDPRFRVEPSYKFEPGRIFKVVWPEPRGQTPGSLATSNARMTDGFGSEIFVGIRRFIVVAKDSGHCMCVPILTYGGQGGKKKGVKPEKHGIIYQKGSRGSKPKLLNGEPNLGFSPVKVELFDETERLAKESRVNYAKFVTVEHNFRVFFIGRVHSSDWHIVFDAVNKCWNQKDRYPRTL